MIRGGARVVVLDEGELARDENVLKEEDGVLVHFEGDTRRGRPIRRGGRARGSAASTLVSVDDLGTGE